MMRKLTYSELDKEPRPIVESLLQHHLPVMVSWFFLWWRLDYFCNQKNRTGSNSVQQMNVCMHFFLAFFMK
jgi:hypothetical protein